MTDSSENIRVDVIAALKKILPRPAAISGATHIVQDLGLDSLAIMNFMLEIEDRFDISIPLDRAADIATVDDLVRAIEALVKQEKA